MKTPDRDYFATTASAHAMFTKPGTSNKLDARWKRKNRIKQLKRTIARLHAENTHLRIELAEALTECYSGYHKGVEVGFSQGFKHGSRELIKLEILSDEHRKEMEK